MSDEAPVSKSTVVEWLCPTDRRAARYDQIREVFRHALRDGDLHEDCSACQERIDAAIAACVKHAPTAPMWVVPVLNGQPAPDAAWGPDCGLVVAHGDGHDVRFEIVPPAAVWVVIGHIDYEGDDIQSIHADEQSARAERDRLATQARQAREDRKLAAHDSYTVERYEVRR